MMSARSKRTGARRMTTEDFLAQDPSDICSRLLPTLNSAMFHAMPYQGCVDDAVRASLSVLKHAGPISNNFLIDVHTAMGAAPHETFSDAFDRARALECVVAVCTEPCSYCNICGEGIAGAHANYYLVSVLGTRWAYLVGTGACAEKFLEDVETVYTAIQTLLTGS